MSWNIQTWKPLLWWSCWRASVITHIGIMLYFGSLTTIFHCKISLSMIIEELLFASFAVLFETQLNQLNSYWNDISFSFDKYLLRCFCNLDFLGGSHWLSYSWNWSAYKITSFIMLLQSLLSSTSFFTIFALIYEVWTLTLM